MDNRLQNNDFEKEIDELKEWQDNQFNLGYYIGTGRVQKPLAALSKHPWVLIVIGMFMLLPVLFVVFSIGSVIESIGLIIPLILSAAFIYGGVARLIEQKKGRK